MQLYLRKYFILTLALTAYLLIVPIFTQFSTTTATEEIIFFALLLSTLYTVAHNKLLLVIGMFLTAVTFWATLTTDNPSHPKFIFGIVCALILLITVIAVIIYDVIISKDIFTDTIFGAISAYLLIGVSWALIYLLVDKLLPGSILINVETPHKVSQLSGEGSFNVYNYFSFVTMTTLGYGDIIPTHPVTRALATYQAIFGQMYIAILVARLVAMHISKK